MFWSLTETDDVYGNAAKWSSGCKGGGPEAENQVKNLWEVSVDQWVRPLLKTNVGD